jgi:hypothetical protein
MNFSCLPCPQHVADVLAEKALDALAEFLHAIDVRLRHPPGAVGRVGLARRELLDARFARKLNDTSVTRSLMSGNARIGSTVTGSFRSSEFNRVMHISLGRPLISAEHDPHLPALQFQRQARSGACSAWTRCTASRTTMPSETSVLVLRELSGVSPPPRQILKVAWAITASAPQ